MTGETCKVCNAPVVPVYKGRNDWLLVYEYPDEKDKDRGVPCSGDNGEILKYELSRHGVNLWDCNLMAFWLHDKNKDENCFAESIKRLTFEMAGRKVLLMGAELSKYFLEKSVTDLSGLVVTSPLFPKSAQFVMVANSPSVVLHQPLGEFRESVRKYVERCKKADIMGKVLNDNIDAWKELANE